MNKKILHYQFFNYHYQRIVRNCLNRLTHSSLKAGKRALFISIILLCSEINFSSLRAPLLRIPNLANARIEVTYRSLPSFWFKVFLRPINIWPTKRILLRPSLSILNNYGYKVSEVKELIKQPETGKVHRYSYGQLDLFNRTIIPDSLDFPSVTENIDTLPFELTRKIGPIMTNGPPFSLKKYESFPNAFLIFRKGSFSILKFKYFLNPTLLSFLEKFVKNWQIGKKYVILKLGIAQFNYLTFLEKGKLWETRGRKANWPKATRGFGGYGSRVT